MLRILWVTILLVSGNVESLYTYEQVNSILRFAIPLLKDQRNAYFQVKTVRHYENGDKILDYYLPTYITFLQDITPDLGLQLAIEWHGIYKSKQGEKFEILQNVEYQDFCSALENQTPTVERLLSRPDRTAWIKWPTLFYSRGELQNTEFVFPWDGMPETIRAEFEVDCDSWLIFSMGIEAENSTKENQIKYLHTGWLSFVGCLE